MADKPTVTVLIPTLNCAKDLKSCLKALGQQTYEDFTVTIVDGYSKDGTVEVAEEFGATIIYDKGKTRGHACNTALSQMTEDIIVFTDADTMPKKNWLENLVRHFDREEVSSVGGPNVAPPNDPYVGKCADVTYGSLIMTGDTRYGKIMKEVVPISHNPGCNAAYRKSVIDDVRGFEPDLPTAEDLVLDHSITEAGYKIFFDPEAVVFHKRRPTLKGYTKQIYRYGIGRAMANRRHPGLKSKFHILPTLGIFGFILLTMAALASYYLLDGYYYQMLPLFFLVGVVALYFILAFFGASQSHSYYAKGMYVIGAPILILLGHLAWGIGYFKGLRMPMADVPDKNYTVPEKN